MQYIPKLTAKEIAENHQYFIERVSVYKKRGLDFLKSREFILEKALPLQGNILEIGAGTGYTTLALAKSGCRFASIDRDKEALKTTALNLASANLLSNVRLYVMDGKSLTFENNSFRNVVVINLFHHINDINRILSETDRVLCMNGRLILADFNKQGMKIVDSVHKEEGRVHEDSEISRDFVFSYFHALGYEIKSYEDNYHWILIAKKEIHQ